MNAKLLCLPLLLSCLSLQAEIFKTVDAEGNVVYTDKPGLSQNAEPVTIQTPNTVDAQPVKPYTPSNKAEPVADYKSLSISPANDSTIRSNNGSFSVTLQLTPNLHPGHKIKFYFDGQLQPGSSLSYQFTNVDRGTHSLKAEVVDGDGKVVISQSNSVHVQRVTASNAYPKSDDEISILPVFDDLISILPWVGDDDQPVSMLPVPSNEEVSTGLQPSWPKDRLVSYEDANGNQRTSMMAPATPIWPKDRINQ